MAKATVKKQEVAPEEVPAPEATPVQAVKPAPKTVRGLTIGSIVHYVLPNGKHRPAIVLFAQADSTAHLHIFTNGMADVDQLPDARNGLVMKANVTYSKEPTPNTWHWTEG